MYNLTEISVFPIKSLGGISLKSSVVEERGLRYDRRWLLVYEDGTFFTQREHPNMALLQPQIDNGGLSVKHKQNKLPAIKIPGFPDGKNEISVTIWKDQCIAQTYNPGIDTWFSNALGFKCRLVYMPDSTKRKVNPEYAEEKIVSFADGYPFLIVGEESLNDLNRRMEIPLTMNRFRTNFVFSGGNPFDEDKWEKIKIGKIEFKISKPCERCTITTINQDLGIKGKEPLSTLAKFRKETGKVLFGQNMVAENTGEISVGNEILTGEWNADQADFG